MDDVHRQALKQPLKLDFPEQPASFDPS